MHFTDNQTRYTLPLLLRLVHTQRKCKKQDTAFAMPCLLAESEGLGSLRSPASLLRKLSYYRLLLARLRLAKDCKGSLHFCIKRTSEKQGLKVFCDFAEF